MPHINPNHGQNAINSMGTLLPQYIHGLYYYDYIGNISTSHAAREDEYVNFHLEPRFPIFGQWKTDWNQGYNMPTSYHLFQDVKNSLEHTLEIDFMHGYDKSLTEDYTVKVILPEGSSNIRVIMPSGCGITNEHISIGKYFGTLDWFGRPELKIHKTNVVHDLCDDTLRVKYTFDNSKDLALEPICMFAMLFSLFALAMFLTRIGFDTGVQYKKVSIEDKSKTN